MTKLLKIQDNYRWDLNGIEFAINERVGNPKHFIGRVDEMEYLYGWADRIKTKNSRSLAFLGRRKIGKTLILERLYNIIYSENNGLIPFLYEFKEGKVTAKVFAEDFITRFYLQVIGYYTRDISWIRYGMEKCLTYNLYRLIEEVKELNFINKDICLKRMKASWQKLNDDSIPYEYVQLAAAAPDAFATTIGVEDKVIQIMDEVQYLNSEINAGEEKILSKCYMSIAESKVAPLLVTGSLMGVVSEQLMLYTPHRFDELIVPKMKEAEAVEMTLNYGNIYGYNFSEETAKYIIYITNNVPGRIHDHIYPKLGKPAIHNQDDADKALEYEVTRGVIKRDWFEYLDMAMEQFNSINMKRITYFLCKNEGTFFNPNQIKKEMELDISDEKLQEELYILHKYDIIEQEEDCFGGVFDRTLKKVLMKNFKYILDLPTEDFNSYFKIDNTLDYLKERINALEIDFEQRSKVEEKFACLQGLHNNMKGNSYELEVLLRLIKMVMDSKNGAVEGMDITDLNYEQRYHLPGGEEIDIYLESKGIVLIGECKNYSAKNIFKINNTMIDEFLVKANLAKEKFPDKEVRFGFFSSNGFLPKLENYLREKGVICSYV